MEAVMAHGRPPFASVVSSEQTHTLGDLAEVAARLGSVVRYYRSGNVVWADGFDSGYACWQVDLGVGSSSIALDTTWPEHGTHCVALTATGTPGTYAGLVRYAAPTSGGRYGVEVGVRLGSSKAQVTLECQVIRSDVAQRFMAWIDRESRTLKVLDSSGNAETVDSDLKLGLSNVTWMPFKLVIDGDAQAYVWAQLGGMRYDLSEYEPYTYGFTDADAVRVGVYSNNDAGETSVVYVGYAVLTISEP